METRKVWFITRPERDPKFHRDALLALNEATQGFKIKWTGNREAHLMYEKKLSEAGVKRENLSNDGSGGRTWAAMLKTFSYCYTNEDGYLVPTKVGLRIMEGGEKVRSNIIKQILTLQIPNAYFLESGFRPKFDDCFRIRPARFLIKLTNQAELDYYLTKEEITFFVLTAYDDNQIGSVVQKIKEFRSLSTEQKQLIKQEIADIYDHRERSDRGARNFENAHSDVAHTFMLICDYTGMVEYIRGKALRVDPAKSKSLQQELSAIDDRYPFNKRYLISLERMAENNGLDIESYKANRLGTVKRVATNRSKTQLKVKQLLEPYPDLTMLSQEEIQNILQSIFPPHEAEKLSFDLKENQTEYNGLNNDFVEKYLNEENNLAFEDKTGEILKAIGFDVVMRPKPIANVDTEIEILVKYGNENAGIIDAKNYRKGKFPLSAAFASHMAIEYIPSYNGYQNRQIEFFGYVTADGFGGEKNLEKISHLVKPKFPDRNIKGIMLTSKVLLSFLDYCLENNLSHQERVDLFLRAIKNKGYSSFGQLLKEVIQ